MELAENGELKKETEGFLIATQDQTLRINAFKAKIDKVTEDSKCRLCQKKDETVDQLISSCSKIAQTDYRERHNKLSSFNATLESVQEIPSTYIRKMVETQCRESAAK